MARRLEFAPKYNDFVYLVCNRDDDLPAYSSDTFLGACAFLRCSRATLAKHLRDPKVRCTGLLTVYYVVKVNLCDEFYQDDLTKLDKCAKMIRTKAVATTAGACSLNYTKFAFCIIVGEAKKTRLFFTLAR